MGDIVNGHIIKLSWIIVLNCRDIVTRWSYRPKIERALLKEILSCIFLDIASLQPFYEVNN